MKRQDILSQVKRLVVKVGTKLLVNEKGGLEPHRMDRVAEELAAVRGQGRELVLVSSGAIVAGLESLGLARRPRDLPRLQAAAAIGQGQLMHHYQNAFSKFGVRIAQVLLTAGDLEERRRHLNIKNTFEALLRQGVIPIVNENDTVSVDEIKFGDNDRLSALVANLIHADLLVILTDQDGFLKEGEVLPMVFEADQELEKWIHHSKDWRGLGGMRSKLEAARIMMRSGELAIIANGFRKGILKTVFEDEVGTIFIPQGSKISGKKRWIAHFTRPQGILVLDEGAVSAVREKGKSLLAPGILALRGIFRAGDTVSLVDSRNKEIGRGRVRCGSSVLEAVLGKKSDERNRILGRGEVIHRDHLVIL